MASDKTKPATKADIGRLDAKIDAGVARLDAKIDAGVARLDAKIDGVERRLDAKIDGVAAALVRTQADVRDIKHTLATRVATKDDISLVLAAIDAFAGKLEVFSRESLTLPATLDAHGQTLRGHDAVLGDHGRRLDALERRP